MPRLFHSHQVIIVDDRFITKAGQEYPKKAIITLYDSLHNLSGTIEMGHIPMDVLWEMIDHKHPIMMDHCYILNFSLEDYRSSRKIEKDSLIYLYDFSASNAFFDCNKTSHPKIDFSYAEFYSKKICFNNAVFTGGETLFTGAKFVNTSSEFEHVYFHNGNVSFQSATFADGEISFKNANFNKGSKNFEDVIFGIGQKMFMNVEFGDGDVSFSNSKFNEGRVSFKVARFGEGKVDFNHTHFGDGETIFELVHFGNGNVSFRSAVFGEGKVDFTRVEFGEGQVSFVNTEFGKGNVNFVNTAFSNGKISFKLARFEEGDIDFHYASFGHGDVIFDRTYFGSGIVDFRAVDFHEGKISFYRTEFVKGDIIFEGSTMRSGAMNFKSTYFGQGVLNFNVVEFQGSSLVFEDVSFDNDSVTLNRAKLKSILLKSCQINRYFDLRVIKCETIDFSESIVRDLIDIRPYEFDIEINALSLSGVRLLGRIYLDWNASNVKHLIYSQDTSYRDKAEQFRILKQNYNAIGQYTYEDEAYIEFKRAEQKADIHDGLKKNPDNKYWLYPLAAFKWLVFDKIGKYATDPVRVIFSMLVVYVLFSFIYIIFPLLDSSVSIVSSLGDPEKLSLVSRAFYISVITFFTIGYGDYYPGGYLKFFAGFEGFIGVFLMSYFTVAFVRKLLR